MDTMILGQTYLEDDDEWNKMMNGEVDIANAPSTQSAMGRKIKKMQEVNPNVVDHEKWLIQNAKKDGTDVTGYANGK